MSEVHRYNVVKMLSEAGGIISYDPHGPEVVMASEFDRVTAERDALQLLLNAADQRADELAGMLALAAVSVDYHAGMKGEDGQHIYDLLSQIRAAFKPVESQPYHGIPGTSFQRLNALANQGE